MDTPLYIVAVSGGVDSVVMLHALHGARSCRIIVAHVDHGIRPDSSADRGFVRTLSQAYGLRFVSTELHLGPDASEEKARTMRWQYLRHVQYLFGADAVATAHHADDVVETMIINISRGTGWRGIASLQETSDIKRPLMSMRKRDILAYARENKLEWREDSTNAHQRYLRNKVRQRIMPRINDTVFNELIRLHDQQIELRRGIETEAGLLSLDMRRYAYCILPDKVAYEMLRNLVGSLTLSELKRIVLFIRTARPGKTLILSNGIQLSVNQRYVIVLSA